MGYLHLLSFALFFSLLVSFGSTQSDVLVYMYNPACNTGCDLTSSANWNGTINSNSTLLISTNQTSTFILNNTQIEVVALSFGDSGSPVTLIINNSTLSTDTLSWSGSSALYATDSFVYSNSIANGSSLFLQDTTFEGSSVYVQQATVNGGKFGAYGVQLVLSLGTATVSNASLLAYAGYIYADNLFSYNNSIDVKTFVVANYTIFQNCIFQNQMAISFNNYSVAEFHDSSVNISLINFNSFALFSFHSDNSNSSLMVTTVNAPVGSELHLGDHVTAVINSGSIYNLTLGDDVKVQLGNTYTTYVQNIQQDSADAFTTITTASRVYLITSSPINASIIITGEYGTLYVDQLFLSAGSSISGTGQIIMNGILHCPTCNISIPTVSWSNNTVLDLVTDYLYTTNMIFQGNEGTNATVYGDVIITPTTYTGLQANANYLLVNGSYTQYGGYLNVSVDKHTSATNPLLQVRDQVWLQNVTVVVDASLSLTATSSYLLVNSLSNNMTATGTLVQNKDSAASAAVLKLTQVGGGLYFGVAKVGKRTGLKTWQIAAIAGGGAGAVILIAIIIYAVRRSSHKRNYEKIQH